MMRCTDCGEVNEPRAKFCAGCGNPIMEAGVGLSELAPVRIRVGEGGNLDPTILPQPGGEEAVVTPVMSPVGGPPRLAGGDVRMGGAPQATILEPEPVGGGGLPHGAPAAAAGVTMLEEPDAKPLAGWLIVIRSPDPGQLYRDIPIYHGRNELGRECPMPHRIGDQTASRLHAMIHATPEGNRLTDISRGGTFVNDQRIDVHYLSKDDRVRIGKTTLAFLPLPVATAE